MRDILPLGGRAYWWCLPFFFFEEVSALVSVVVEVVAAAEGSLVVPAVLSVGMLPALGSVGAVVDGVVDGVVGAVVVLSGYVELALGGVVDCGLVVCGLVVWASAATAARARAPASVSAGIRKAFITFSSSILFAPVLRNTATVRGVATNATKSAA